MEINLEGRNCSKCSLFLPWVAFNINSKGKNGRKSICRKCTQKASKELLDKRKIENPEFLVERNRKKMLKSNYGLSLEDYEELLKNQKFKCAICSTKENKVSENMFVDHCHKTGVVRGLLCYHCNTLLGMAKDSTDTLKRAVDYLENLKNG